MAEVETEGRATMSLFKLVKPVVVLALHRQDAPDTDPKVLFVKYRDTDKFTLPFDVIRANEQPYKAVLRIGNSLFELGLEHVRVRCYYSNFITLPGDEAEKTVSLAVYYTLKLWNEEIELIDGISEDLKSTRLDGINWMPVTKAELPLDFDQQMSHSWETLRKAVGSNYGMKIPGKGRQ